MKEIKQRKRHDPDNGSIGDCWKSCLASLMEFPYAGDGDCTCDWYYGLCKDHGSRLKHWNDNTEQ